jgi:hypothetical protein
MAIVRMPIICCALRLAPSNLAYICNRRSREALALSEMRWPVRSIWKVQQPRCAKVVSAPLHASIHVNRNDLSFSPFLCSIMRTHGTMAKSMHKRVVRASDAVTCFPAHLTLPFIYLAGMTDATVVVKSDLQWGCVSYHSYGHVSYLTMLGAELGGCETCARDSSVVTLVRHALLSGHGSLDRLCPRHVRHAGHAVD